MIGCQRRDDKAVVVSTASDSVSVKGSVATEEQYEPSKFNSISEIVAKDSYSVWAKRGYETSSLSLHFQYQNTLNVAYSPECWITFPYKVDGERITVYWDTIIDTKYEFEIVRAIKASEPELVGKPFMELELENDSTLKATYLLPKLIRRINNSSKTRTFFTDRFFSSLEGYI